MALSVEPDALDTLLSLQLRIVEEQLGRRRATDSAGDVWHQELAARQKRLDELDRQNARMAQELDRALTQGPRARPPPAPPPQPPLDSEQKAMLEKSVGLHNELMVVFVCARNGTTDVTRVQRLLEAEEPAGSVAVPYYYGNPRRYQKELGRLVETGLPRLQEWLREAPEILSRFAERVLLMAQRDAPAAELGRNP